MLYFVLPSLLFGKSELFFLLSHARFYCFCLTLNKSQTVAAQRSDVDVRSCSSSGFLGKAALFSRRFSHDEAQFISRQKIHASAQSVFTL